MSIPQAVAVLAVPTILSSLVTVLYNLADTYFVALLGDPLQNAAVTLAAPAMLAFNAISNLFGVGGSTMMSRALGRRDYERVEKASTFGIWCAILCGVLYSAACAVFQRPLLALLGADTATAEATSAYLFWTVTLGAAPAILNVVMAQLVRAEGSALHASIGTMSGCLLNIVLDPIFVLLWGLDMGAAGAGLATFLSNCVACGYFFVLLTVRRGRTYVCCDIRKLRFEPSIVREVCMVGIPASIQNLLNVTGITVLNNFTAAYGAAAVAAMGIAQKVQQVAFYIANGLSQGIMPLVSYQLRQRQHHPDEKELPLCGPAGGRRDAWGLGALLGLCREADRSVYGRPGDCRDRGDVSAGICTGAVLSVPGLSGCGGVPVGGAWAVFAAFRCAALAGAGDPGAVCPQYPLPALRAGLRPVCRRAVPGHRRSGAAGAAVPAAGAGAGGPCRRSGVVCQSFHALPALFR